MSTVQTTVQIDEPADPPQVEPAMVKLLAHRYGDGLVYLRGREDRSLYHKAQRLGLISREGYVTRVGRDVLARSGR